MEDSVRAAKEEIIKNKLDNEEVDLSNISDEDVDKIVTEDDKAEAIKATTDIENLDVENLSAEDKDKLLGALKKEETLSSILTSDDMKEAKIQRLCTYGFNESEAEEVYADSLVESTSAIDKIYEMLHCEGAAIPKDDPRDQDVEYKEPVKVEVSAETPIESLESQEGEKLGDAPKIPTVEYAYKDEAKKMEIPEEI